MFVAVKLSCSSSVKKDRVRLLKQWRQDWLGMGKETENRNNFVWAVMVLNAGFLVWDFVFLLKNDAKMVSSVHK